MENHALFSNEELGIKPSNFKQRNVILGWDLSQSPPGQSFEMTQEMPLSLYLKLRAGHGFVTNVKVYCKYDLEIEILNNKKIICHEYA